MVYVYIFSIKCAFRCLFNIKKKIKMSNYTQQELGEKPIIKITDTLPRGTRILIWSMAIAIIILFFLFQCERGKNTKTIDKAIKTTSKAITANNNTIDSTVKDIPVQVKRINNKKAAPVKVVVYDSISDWFLNGQLVRRNN